MSRNGSRPFGYRDLAGDRAVEVAATSQSWICRGCGTTAIEHPVDLVEGYRITPRLFDAVGRMGAVETASRVAARMDLPRRTVARIHRGWTLVALDAMTLPDACRVERSSDGKTVVCDGRDGSLLVALPEPDDPLLADIASRMSNRLVACDHVHAALVRRHAPPSAHVVVDPGAVLRWYRAALPRILARARVWLDASERRTLARIEHVVRLDRRLRTSEQDRFLSEAGAASAIVGRLAGAVDAFASIWTLGDGGRARTRLEDWRRDASAFLLDAFAPVLAFVERLSGFLFGPLHGVPATLATVVALNAAPRAAFVVPRPEPDGRDREPRPGVSPRHGLARL